MTIKIIDEREKGKEVGFDELKIGDIFEFKHHRDVCAYRICVKINNVHDKNWMSLSRPGYCGLSEDGVLVCKLNIEIKIVG